MPELPARQEATPEPAHLPAALAPPGEERAPQSAVDHAGIYPLFRQALSEAGGQEPPGDRVTALLARPEYAYPVNDAARARVMGDLQRDFGNASIQRLAARTPVAAPPPLLRRGSGTAPEPPAALPGGGHPLDSATESAMSSSFGHDFSGVRVHDDAAAHNAADSLHASAFTAGRDIYFSRGASAGPGSGLLAHELAHVVQHDAGATSAATGVSEPGDPLERQADAMSAAALAGEPVPRPGGGVAPAIQRQPQPAAPPAPGGGGPAAPPTASPGDYIIGLAGFVLPLPMRDLLRRARAGKITVPPSMLRKIPTGPIKITALSIDLDENKVPVGGSLSASANIPPIDGSGTLNIDKDGNASGDIKIHFSGKKIPGLQDVNVDAHVERDKFTLETDVGFAFPHVTGSLHYKYANGHSGKGKARYEGAKMQGEIEVILSEAGKVSGSGKLEAELFKNLRAAVDVAVDEKGEIKVAGKLTFAQQIELFPEKKYEKNFFEFERRFSLWGFTIPVIDVSIGLFAEIHASAGFRAKFGPGVLRNIEVTGEFGTDPESVTQFGVSGEFFLPAGAEIVATFGGGLGLGALIAELSGGIEAVGVAGIYSALSVRPQFNYTGGKYKISGTAELAGVAQLKLGINAYAKIRVGVWRLKKTVWRKDWNLAEWIWNTGLNVSLRAGISYTFGEDFVPDVTFEVGQIDPEKLIRDVMPESGSPVPAPPKPPVADKGTFTAEGAAGAPAPGAPGQAPAPPTPGTPAGATQGAAEAPAGAPGAKDEKLPAVKVVKPFSMAGQPHTLTATIQSGKADILMASPGTGAILELIDNAIAELDRDQLRDTTEKDQLRLALSQLRSAANPNELTSDFNNAAQREGFKLDEAEKWLEMRLADMVRYLTDMARRYKLKSLEGLAKEMPPLRYLPMEFRGADWIKPNLYGLDGAWTEESRTRREAEVPRIKAKLKTGSLADWNELEAAEQIPDGKTFGTFGPDDVHIGLYAVDHQYDVWKHWNAVGNNVGDQARNDYAFDRTGEAMLRVITGQANSRRPKRKMDDFVKRDFTTALGDERSIQGKPFLHSDGKPIVEALG